MTVSLDEMTHDDLIERARVWLLRSVRHADDWSNNRGPCPLVITEMTSAARETPDAIGWSRGFSFLVECKASRNDFKADQRKFFRREPGYGIGDFRYYMTPRGLLKQEELPAKWGLLEVGETGFISLIKKSEKFEIDFAEERLLLLSLIRRLDVKPDANHIKVKAYTIDDGRPPRATVTFNKRRAAEDGMCEMQEDDRR